MPPLKEPTAVKSLSGPKGYFPNDNLEQLSREAQQFISLRKTINWQSNNCWFDKEEKALVRAAEQPARTGD